MISGSAAITMRPIVSRISIRPNNRLRRFAGAVDEDDGGGRREDGGGGAVSLAAGGPSVTGTECSSHQRILDLLLGALLSLGEHALANVRDHAVDVRLEDEHVDAGAGEDRLNVA